jgi:hypothetical protein
MNQKKKIFEEHIKTRHTTHWDWDYLPLRELEALAGKHLNEVQEKKGHRFEAHPKTSSKQALWGVFLIVLSLGIMVMVLLYS